MAWDPETQQDLLLRGIDVRRRQDESTEPVLGHIALQANRFDELEKTRKAEMPHWEVRLPLKLLIREYVQGAVLRN